MRSRRRFDGAIVALIAAAAMLSQADMDAPPRGDGAGYAVLARSLLEGKGYRAIDHPDEPRHAHFPPGYPALLAAVWGATGVSPRSARAASIVCNVGATVAAWLWFRTMYSRRSSLMLGLALAVNWSWDRAGVGIRSEPLFHLLGWLAVLAAASRRPRGGWPRGLLVGLTLGAACLTRQAGLALAAAMAVELGSRGNRRALAGAAVAFAATLAPWLAWSAQVARDEPSRTQAGLLWRAAGDLPATLPRQALFYMERIPDQLTAPLVEVATVFAGSPALRWGATAWAAVVSAVVLVGLLATLRDRRRRLAGLVALTTLGMLLAWPYTEAGRFLIPLLPALIVGAAEGMAAIGRRLGLRRRGARRMATLLVLVAAIPYAASSIATSGRRARAERQPDLDAACAWLRAALRRGPVLTRHPGEVFLRSGRKALEVPTAERPGDLDADPEDVAATIRRYGVGYILIDADPYLNAAPSPLERYVAERPEDAREVARFGKTRVYEVGGNSPRDGGRRSGRHPWIRPPWERMARKDG